MTIKDKKVVCFQCDYLLTIYTYTELTYISTGWQFPVKDIEIKYLLV